MRQRSMASRHALLALRRWTCVVAFRLDPMLCPGALDELEPMRQRPAGRALAANSPETPMDKTSFTERLALLRKTAEQLRTAAEIVLAEVQHMEAAQQRFAARSGRRTQKADR